MRTILGIAIELFEYNTAWRSSVLFLAFFIITIASLQIMERPTVKVSSSETGKAVKIIADHIGVTEETQKKAKSLMEMAKGKYQDLKYLKEESVSTEDEVSTKFDRKTETQHNQNTQPEPITLDALDTLNEL